MGSSPYHHSHTSPQDQFSYTRQTNKNKHMKRIPSESPCDSDLSGDGIIPIPSFPPPLPQINTAIQGKQIKINTSEWCHQNRLAIPISVVMGSSPYHHSHTSPPDQYSHTRQTNRNKLTPPTPSESPPLTGRNDICIIPPPHPQLMHHQDGIFFLFVPDK